MTNLAQLYEERNAKTLTVALAVAGHLLEGATNITWSFEIGLAATCSFHIAAPGPEYLIEDQHVLLFVGFDNQTRLQFNGTIRSINHDENGLDIECVGQGSRLDAPYKRTVTATDGIKSSNELVLDIVTAAGFISGDVFIDLPAWTPGQTLPQPLEFQTYGEAVLALSQPYGSPWYEMPSGQIRIELRDPIPAPGSWRTYFTGILGAGYDLTLPANVTNAAALPRVRAAHSEKLLAEIRNKVIVRGAQLPESGPGGESNYLLLEETADAPSPWLPTINGFEQFMDEIYSNPLLDDIDDVIAMAARYLVLRNRLDEDVRLVVDGDPQAFLGGTVTVTDLPYSQVNANYFVKGYTCSIDDGDFVTEYSLVGGRASGFSPRLSPFCDFTWSDRYSAIPFKTDKLRNDDANRDQAASKIQQYVPAGTGNADMGEGVDGRMVAITFDGSPSFDPDGQIVSYDWSDDQGHVHTGIRFTALYNPDDAGSVNVTLIVTDDDGRTGTVTHYVNINTFGPIDGYETGADSSAGGVFNIPTIAVAGDPVSFVSEDGGETFTEAETGLEPRDGVVMLAYKDTGKMMIVFWRGSQVFTSLDNGATLFSSSGLNGIVADMAVIGDGTLLAAAGASVYISEDYAVTWRLYGTPHPGVLGFAGPSGQTDPPQHLKPPYVSGVGVYKDTGDGVYASLNTVVVGNNWAPAEDPGFSSQYLVPNPNTGPILRGPTGGLFVKGSGPWYSVDSAGQMWILDPASSTVWVAIGPERPGLICDLWVEDGLDGVLLISGDDGLSKSVDGGATAAPIPGITGPVCRISFVNVPQTIPAADLYAIVTPND